MYFCVPPKFWKRRCGVCLQCWGITCKSKEGGFFLRISFITFRFPMFDLDKNNETGSDYSVKIYLRLIVVYQIPTKAKLISAEWCNDTLTVFLAGLSFSLARVCLHQTHCWEDHSFSQINILLQETVLSETWREFSCIKQTVCTSCIGIPSIMSTECIRGEYINPWFSFRGNHCNFIKHLKIFFSIF